MVRIVDPMSQHSTSANLAPVYPSTATISGHPIHVMLVAFPVAFFTAVLVTDIVFLSNDHLFWAEASRWLLGAGIVTGLLAAVFGIVDFLTVPQVRAQIEGWLHPISAVATVLIALVNLLVRWNDPVAHVSGWGITLSALGFITLLAAGWLGGELVHRHRIGVAAAEPEETTAFRPRIIEPIDTERAVGGRFVPQTQKTHQHMDE